MNEINFFNESNINLEEYMEDLKRVIDISIKKEELNNIEFSVILVNDEYIKKINKDYRKIDKSTDVITFALEDKEDVVKTDKRVLGDIYISVDKAFKQATDYNHSTLRELSFLLIHGFLHLLGYDHDTEEKTKLMREKEERLLNECKIKR